MGTATLTRSQSRKTNLKCMPGAVDRDLPLPIDILPGSHINSSFTRTQKLSNCVNKENTPPFNSSLKKGTLHLNERASTVDPSLQKASKKRKQPLRAPQDSTGSVRASSVGREDLEIPAAFGIESNRDVVAEDKEQSGSVVPDESNMNGNALEEEKRNLGCKQQIGVEQRARVSPPNDSALDLLQKNYEKLFMKYRKLKAKRLNEHEALYNEQKSQICDFVQATEALIEFYKGENVSLRQQLQEADVPELMSRCKSLEIANSKYRIGLVQERSKNLELRQENKKLKSLWLGHIADKQTSLTLLPQTCQKGNLNGRKLKEQDAPATEDHTELVQRLLENVLGLRLSCGGDGHLHFEHHPTGFSFNLKEVQDADVGELVGGGLLTYENLSLGVCKKAVDWMKEKEVVFGIGQAQLLLKRLTGFLNKGSYG